jgi:hypothetical protein
MSRTYHHGERKIRVRGVRRPTDVRRLARALIEMEYRAAQAEVEVEAEHKEQLAAKPKKSGAGTAQHKKQNGGGA